MKTNRPIPILEIDGTKVPFETPFATSFEDGAARYIIVLDINYDLIVYRRVDGKWYVKRDVMSMKDLYSDEGYEPLGDEQDRLFVRDGKAYAAKAPEDMHPAALRFLEPYMHLDWRRFRSVEGPLVPEEEVWVSDHDEVMWFVRSAFDELLMTYPSATLRSDTYSLWAILSFAKTNVDTRFRFHTIPIAENIETTVSNTQGLFIGNMGRLRFAYDPRGSDGEGVLLMAVDQNVYLSKGETLAKAYENIRYGKFRHCERKWHLDKHLSEVFEYSYNLHTPFMHIDDELPGLFFILDGIGTTLRKWKDGYVTEPVIVKDGQIRIEL